MFLTVQTIYIIMDKDGNATGLELNPEYIYELTFGMAKTEVSLISIYRPLAVKMSYVSLNRVAHTTF